MRMQPLVDVKNDFKEALSTPVARVVLSALLALHIANQTTLLLLGLLVLAPPHTLVIAAMNHFYGEALIGLATGALFFLLGVIWYQGGVRRYVVERAILVFLGVMLFAAVGLALFLYYEHWPLPPFWELSRALRASPSTLSHFMMAEGLSLSVPLLLSAVRVWETTRPASRALGNAHFASGLEAHRSGVFEKEEGAILIGKKYGKPLWSNGFEHALVFASSGSGKTRSISIPNLLQYPYSVVCNDVKLSIYKATSGYRERVLGHRCYCFAPTNAQTHRFNPLSFISSDPLKRMTDIQRIAHILMPDSKKDAAIWSQASRKLFKTVVLYLLDTPGELVTLGAINRLIKQPSFDDWLLERLHATDHYDPEFYRNGFSYSNNHDKTRGSIKESFSGYFELFDDPTVDAATSATDFDITALRREKITIYIGFTDDDMERLAPLLTLFWQQLISSMIQTVPDLTEEPYPLLCLLDEFSSLGRIERLRRSLKLLREYRVRCVLMLQYIAQTYEQYSHDEARAFTNIKTKIAYAAEDIQDAETISKLLGTKTKRIHSGSVSNQTQGASQSKSYSYQAIPLMRPEQVCTMSPEKTLIIRTGNAPLKAGQFIWYQELEMKAIAYEPTDVPTQTVRIEPFDHSHKKKQESIQQHEKNPGEKKIIIKALV